MIEYVTAIAWAAEQAAVHEQAASPAATIGLDWRALLFQVANFAILLFLLRRFAYKPLVGVLEARRRKVEESLRNAEQIAKTRATLEEERKNILSAADARADAIVTAAQAAGSRLVTEAEAKAQQRAEQTLSSAQARIEQEVKSLREELRVETLKLVAAATERILREKMDSAKDEELIRQALTEAETAVKRNS